MCVTVVVAVTAGSFDVLGLEIKSKQGQLTGIFSVCGARPGRRADAVTGSEQSSFTRVFCLGTLETYTEYAPSKPFRDV